MPRYWQTALGECRRRRPTGAVTPSPPRWSTSIFPDRKRGTYLLPVKKAVRAAENLAAGSIARVDLVVVS